MKKFSFYVLSDISVTALHVTFLDLQRVFKTCSCRLKVHVMLLTNISITTTPFLSCDLIIIMLLLLLSFSNILSHQHLVSHQHQCCTKQHLLTRIKGYLKTDEKSHIYKHLNESPRGKTLGNNDCFSIKNYATV